MAVSRAVAFLSTKPGSKRGSSNCGNETRSMSARVVFGRAFWRLWMAVRRSFSALVFASFSALVFAAVIFSSDTQGSGRSGVICNL